MDFVFSYVTRLHDAACLDYLVSHRSCLLLTSVVGWCQSKLRLSSQPSPPACPRARWKAPSLRCVLGPLRGSLLSWTRLKHLCGGHVQTTSRNHFSCFFFRRGRQPLFSECLLDIRARYHLCKDEPRHPSRGHPACIWDLFLRGGGRTAL